MAGIAGIAAPGRQVEVERMLEAIRHRGRAGSRVFETEGVTLGAVYGSYVSEAVVPDLSTVRDYSGYGRYAQAQALSGGSVLLLRDPLGVAPLYYGETADGALCFASEVKALRGMGTKIAEVPPGSCCDGHTVSPHFRLHAQPLIEESPERIAVELRRLLDAAVSGVVQAHMAGSWLSGGLDSSALVALARPKTRTLHTFSVGLAGAVDLAYAREVAAFVKSEHHETVVTVESLLRALPEVIHHLESFDALLVRSSVVNYAVAKVASNYVPAVLSGEGGDELFAGYEYLKTLPSDKLSEELLDITGRLHNTALQRVDRCASAHGITAHTCFLDPPVVDLALRIPIAYKLKDGCEKWILRKALSGLLPDRVLQRTKSKFWQGAGVGELLADHAEQSITDSDFRHERRLPSGDELNTKEELLYYRIFSQWYGAMDGLDWVGRSKGAPSAP